MSTAQHQVSYDALGQVFLRTLLNALSLVLTNTKTLLSFPERTKLYKILFISWFRDYLKVRSPFLEAIVKQALHHSVFFLAFVPVLSKI